MEKLTGIHHVTAITSNAKRNYEFFTYVLGMRLVKKTVNQDDINTYHLFYADDQGNAGTDITFFDFKGIDKTIHGTNEISRTSFRVSNDQALDYWVKRFGHYKVEYEPIKEYFGKKMLFFRDYDDQRYALVSDENNKGVSGGKPWINGPVPLEFAIYGLGPIFTVVNNPEVFGKILQEIMLMRKSGEEGKYSLYEMGEGGTGAQVIVETNYVLPQSRQGYGAIHHVAFRVDDEKMLLEWDDHLTDLGANTSGYVDRFYFQSVYTRLYPGILFELATDGPGFIDDEESYETLGETLALPPRFRDKREWVESVVRPFDTVRSTKQIKKEYFNESGELYYGK